MSPSQIIVLATPVFFLLIAIELAVGYRRQRNTYRLADAVSSISLGMLSQTSAVFTRLLRIGIYTALFEHVALWRNDVFWTSLPGWLLALVFYDFCYYWLHRAGHESALFWVHDFPRDTLRPGWRIAIDPAVPTTRTNEQPYTAGVNYTTIIDGFIASPNVTVEAVRDIPWLPPTCGYRLIRDGEDLYWWHPLVSGNPETVHQAGISARGRTVSEDDVSVDDFEDYVVDWPLTVGEKAE